VDFHAYTGDRAYLELVRRMLDHELAHGTTPADWPWAQVPYASADPGSAEYHGATKWEWDGMRGDGLHGVEPDKIGELGMGYLRFYEITEEPKYLEAALRCGDALAKHVRDLVPNNEDLIHSAAHVSPWPFRVNARTGVVIDDYTANVIEPIRLFDELLRVRERIGLAPERAAAFQRARTLAWQWLLSRNGPLFTGIWNGYFEDVPSDPKLMNRVQIIPMETARYLLEQMPADVDAVRQAEALAAWVRAAFGERDEPSINEQAWCFVPMGSHTARYASVEALLFERTGETRFKEEAYRYFNWASYCTAENGIVSVGPRWTGTWWSDGYGDYIRHFLEGMAAVPEWAPANENHLLRTSSIVQEIRYDDAAIHYRVFDGDGTERLRVTAKPQRVLAGDRELAGSEEGGGEGWSWRPLAEGGVTEIRRRDAREISVVLR
jgi:hypothetical protein